MDKAIRKIKTILKAKPTIEGAGVRLKRVFGHPENPLFDPFLLMDDFHSDNPDDYMAGFPMHPHRGIETITYLLHGTVAHRDSMGNEGIIHGGDIQWMTAGSGIIHEEMPARSEPELWGFQLWANLPASHKMMPPRYQEIKSAEVPEVSYQKGVIIKVIAGQIGGVSGPVQDVVTDPAYLDVTVQAHTEIDLSVKAGHTCFVYVIGGAGAFADDPDEKIAVETLVLFDEGEVIRVSTGDFELRFLLISGKPINEPIAWAGPIVMNTTAEIEAAFKAYQNGTFIQK